MSSFQTDPPVVSRETCGGSPSCDVLPPTRLAGTREDKQLRVVIDIAGGTVNAVYADNGVVVQIHEHDRGGRITYPAARPMEAWLSPCVDLGDEST